MFVWGSALIWFIKDVLLTELHLFQLAWVLWFLGVWLPCFCYYWTWHSELCSWLSRIGQNSNTLAHGQDIFTGVFAIFITWSYQPVRTVFRESNGSLLTIFFNYLPGATFCAFSATLCACHFLSRQGGLGPLLQLHLVVRGIPVGRVFAFGLNWEICKNIFVVFSQWLLRVTQLWRLLKAEQEWAFLNIYRRAALALFQLPRSCRIFAGLSILTLIFA